MREDAQFADGTDNKKVNIQLLINIMDIKKVGVGLYAKWILHNLYSAKYLKE